MMGRIETMRGHGMDEFPQLAPNALADARIAEEVMPHFK
jgi:hypothetical protein